jgi:hypothetical protein
MFFRHSGHSRKIQNTLFFKIEGVIPKRIKTPGSNKNMPSLLVRLLLLMGSRAQATCVADEQKINGNKETKY